MKRVPWIILSPTKPHCLRVPLKDEGTRTSSPNHTSKNDPDEESERRPTPIISDSQEDKLYAGDELTVIDVLHRPGSSTREKRNEKSPFYPRKQEKSFLLLVRYLFKRELAGEQLL